MKEVFKDIPSYEGIYEVSNLGKVRSIKRLIKTSIREYYWGGKEIKPFLTRGYLRVCLRKDNKEKKYSVHQLVAMAFLGHEPCGMEKVINHKNFNTLNNEIKNIEIVKNRINTNKKHIPSSSKEVGVSLRKNGTYISRILVNKKSISLGSFTTENEASEYYKNALNAIENGTEIIVKRKEYTSSIKGICYRKDRKKWMAYLLDGRKSKFIGNYNTEQEAINARNEKIKELSL